MLHAATDAAQGEVPLTITAAGPGRSHDIPLPLVAMGAPGTVDKSFHWTPSFSPNARIVAVAVQPDGKIVVAGPPVVTDPVGSNIVLCRYLADGSLDTTFSVGVIAFESAITSISAMALQTDGKIVIVGASFDGGIVMRYNTDGTSDSAFGQGGQVTLDFSAESPTSTEFDAVAIQPDGGLLIAGYTTAAGQNRDAMVARLTPEGSVDRSFGTLGHATAPFGSGQNKFLAMGLQSDGRIVAAGTAVPVGVSSHAVLARFDQGGQLDNSFHGNGMFAVGPRETVGGLGSVGWIFVQSDAKIVAGGAASEGIALVRLNGSDGSVDLAFGANGIKQIGIDIGYVDPSPFIGGMIQDADGHIIIGGGADNGVLNPVPDSGWNSDTFIARLASDGLLDFSFSGGVIAHDFSADNGRINGTEAVSAITSDADGRVIVASWSLDENFSMPIYSTLGRFWP